MSDTVNALLQIHGVSYSVTSENQKVLMRRIYGGQAMSAEDFNYLAERVEIIEDKIDWLIAFLSQPPPLIVKPPTSESQEQAREWLRQIVANEPHRPTLVYGDPETDRGFVDPPAPRIQEMTNGEDE